METQNTPSKSHLQYGVFFGLLMILTFVLMFIFKIDPLEHKTMSTFNSILNYFFLPIIFIYLGCLDFKKKNGGYISFPESLKAGVSIAFVGTLIFAVFTSIFYYLVPEYLEMILDLTKQVMLKQNPNIKPEQLEAGIEMSRKFSSPLISVPLTLIIFSFLGLIYSCIIGMIVKKENTHRL